MRFVDVVMFDKARNDALEEAANLCDEYVDSNDGIEAAMDTQQIVTEIAAAIRAMKECGK